MRFAKIENGICINILEFDTKENAYNFDGTLVEFESGYGIGDFYIDGTWEKHQKTEKELRKERVEQIHLALEELDKIINRATEDLYELTNSEPYPTVQEAIEQKEKLRIELQELTKEE